MVYLKLIRPLNILMIVLTMVLFRFAIADNRYYLIFDFQPKLDNTEFMLLLLVTVLVAAGGYVINDIFDAEIDRVNRPEKLLIDRVIDPLKAYNFYKVLVTAGIITAIVLAFRTKNIRLSTVPVLITVALNFYAQYFKKQLLVGNIVVAVCAAFVVFLPGLYESEKSTVELSLSGREIESGIFLAASFYAVFAFLTTFLREVVKDIEDMKGDDLYGCRTVPIVWGLKGAKWLCALLVLILLLTWTSVAFFFPAMYMPHAGWFVLALYILPLIVFLFVLYHAHSQAHYRRLSAFVKVYMLLGVCSMVYFLFNTTPYLLFLHYANYLRKIF